MNNNINYILLALLIFVISLLIYFLIKWAVREEIKEAYHDITGKTTYENKKNKELANEIKESITKIKNKKSSKKGNIFFVYINLTKLQKCDKI